MRIAVIQTNSSDEIDHNLEQTSVYIQSAADQGAKMVFLPECFALMQRHRSQLGQLAEEAGKGKIQSFLSVMAAQYGLWLFAGSVPLKTDTAERITNTLLVFDSQGHRVARYDKIHLFDVVLCEDEKYLESAYTQSGSSVEVVDTPGGKVGLSICYDLRFPELYRQLCDKGAELLIVPSAFAQTTGRFHWLPLLTARAIENACYVIAAAQVGIHPSGRRTFGHSVVIDPWGEVLANKETDCGVLLADIDLSRLHQIRRQFPSLQHRRIGFC